jgi:hypothetical protein
MGHWNCIVKCACKTRRPIGVLYAGGTQSGGAQAEARQARKPAGSPTQVQRRGSGDVELSLHGAACKN